MSRPYIVCFSHFSLFFSFQFIKNIKCPQESVNTKMLGMVLGDFSRVFGAVFVMIIGHLSFLLVAATSLRAGFQVYLS